MKVGLVLLCGLFLVNSAMANYGPSISSAENVDDHYQTLASGTGLIAPPYQTEFYYLLVAEPGWLHFVFSHPLDPGQQQELEEYGERFGIDWSICWLKLDEQTWTAISLPVTGEPALSVSFFLRHLKRLSFFVDWQ